MEGRPSTEAILLNMNSAMLVVDAEARITFCNPPAEKIFRETADALCGASVWDWLDGSPGEPSLLGSTLAEGARFRGAESRITRRDGTVVPIGISCSPLVDASGARIGAVAVFQDLTEASQLQRRVLQQEKLASIGQLSAGVAHEINNPMGFIHANLFQMGEYLGDLRRVWISVQELQKAARSDDLEALHGAVEELEQTAREVDVEFVLSDLGKAIRESQEGSERIRHIVNDLRDFSHRDTGQLVLADVNQCLDSTANIVWPMMKHVVVLEKRYGELPPVCCNPMQLKQVFMNLLVNAFQAIEERVGDRGETGCIALETSRHGERVAIEIRDDGVGIEAENLERIFDPFFTTKGVGSGTGLGLSTSFSIVRRHGGEILARSRRGAGSAFRVLLPLRGPGEEEP